MARTQLPSSFHGTSLLSRRSQGGRQLTFPSFHITCSSVQSHWTRAPISKRHISSILTSSLQMQTPQGEALLAMTKECMPPVLVSQAASQQLELLAIAAAECTRSKEREGVLHRRIAEIKECEITKAVQDISLALVTHRLLHATLDHVPDQTAPRQQHDSVALQRKTLDDRLQAIHPPSLQSLIDRHVALVINGKDRAQRPFEPHLLARVCPLEMGKMYAASIMHGYLLARVYQRFKLERVLHLQVSMDPGHNRRHVFQSVEEEVSMEAYLQSEAFKDKEAFLHLNNDTLHVIERHCQVLFGVHTKPLNIQLGSVRSLILQALAFGALLWDVENNFISSFYPFL